MTSPVFPRGALLARLGAWMQVAQLLGLAALLATLHSARSASSLPSATEANAIEVARGETIMNEATQYLFLGTGIAVIGMILVIIAATYYRYRAQWFFWFLCIYGAAMCISYMLPFGLCFLLIAYLKRKEFDLDPAPEPGTMVR
ncbi:hypothetical protein WJU23_03665 [Prosthecobacter sp. SYSU 5D2]|uniref:hypothetical protein n=1 Tax=Prosthecobacter sp. SYSU 5D2 TaxID=3134134 RepID=UPI0031FEBD9C